MSRSTLVGSSLARKSVKVTEKINYGRKKTYDVGPGTLKRHDEKLVRFLYQGKKKFFCLTKIGPNRINLYLAHSFLS